jgi:hypothetical protein
MKLKKPHPGNGKCDAMRCKEAPGFRHQNPADGTTVELCQRHSEKHQAEHPEWDVFPMAAKVYQTHIVGEDLPATLPTDLPEPEILEPDALQHVQETSTELATLTQAAFVAALRAEVEEQQEALALVQAMEIQSPEDFGFLEEVLAETQTEWKTYEKRRTSFTQPANAILREFNSWFKPVQGALKEIEKTAKAKLSQYRFAQAQEQQRLLAAAQKAEAPAEIKETLVKAAEAVPTPTSTVYIDRWLFAIDDADQLPREFLKPDETKIGQVVAALKDKTKIAGVRVWNEPIVRGNKRK